MYLPTESQRKFETALTNSIVNWKKQTINIDQRWVQKTSWEEKVRRDLSLIVNCTTWEAEQQQQQPLYSQILCYPLSLQPSCRGFPLLRSHSRSSIDIPLDNPAIKNSQRRNIPYGKCGCIISGYGTGAGITPKSGINKICLDLIQFDSGLKTEFVRGKGA